MADEYIKRKAAIQYFKERSKDFIGHDPISPALVIMGCANEIDAIPAADVREVVRRRWKRVDPRSTVVTFRCSECDYYAPMDATNFCPNCGADMRPSEEPESLIYIPPEKRSGVDDD